MKFKGITYIEHQITDKEVFNQLPSDLKEFYEQINGMVCYQGGLQVRGCVATPKWNSLYDAWKGKYALHLTYKEMLPSDIPFAQDCIGDQYFLREATVWHLMGDTGEAEDMQIDLITFFDQIIADPVEMLCLEPLLHFLDEGNELAPGELLQIRPPFAVELSDQESYEFENVPSGVQLSYLAKFYKEQKA